MTAADIRDLIASVGFPIALLMAGGFWFAHTGWPWITDYLTTLQADHVAHVKALIANNEKQREEHLAREAQERADFLAALKSITDQMAEMSQMVRDTNHIVNEMHDDFRAWNGIERRRVPPVPKNRQP